jgi:acetyl-CoA carboxylase biotin carboxyl carrier protein
MVDIEKIIETFDKSNINELEIKENGTKISLKKYKQEDFLVSQSENIDVKKYSKTEDNGKLETEISPIIEKPDQSKLEVFHQVKSPMVGTFYVSASPEEDPYVKVGEYVTENTVLCMVEAMKLFNEIEAEIKGEIVDVLVENGQLVEFGQPLFLIEKK